MRLADCQPVAVVDCLAMSDDGVHCCGVDFDHFASLPTGDDECGGHDLWIPCLWTTVAGDGVAAGCVATVAQMGPT